MDRSERGREEHGVGERKREMKLGEMKRREKSNVEEKVESKTD